METLAQSTPAVVLNPIYGITVDDVDESDKNQCLDKSDKSPPQNYDQDRYRPDQVINDDYVAHVREISQVSDVMALVADSHDMYKFREDGDKTCVGRVDECFTKLGEFVRIWEIGNEVNGEWTDYPRGDTEDDDAFDKRLESELPTKSYQELDAIRRKVAKQITDAFHYIDDHGGQTALTFYYNQHLGKGCWSSDARGGNEYEMLTWANKYVTDQRMRDRLKYVFIRFYEDDCKISKHKKKQDAPGFADKLNKLAGIFKYAGLDFGEFGPQCKACKDSRTCCIDQQKEFIARYYKDYDKLIRPLVRNYVGGYFYWYFLQDMVPKEKQAMGKLKEVLGE